MNKPQMTLVPVGGLANRMRAVASACHLCRTIGGSLRVVWFRDWALNARFSDIFEPLPASDLTLREATLADYALLDRPRRHNLWLPKLPQRVMFSRRIYEYEVTPLRESGFDFARWAACGRGKSVYMACYSEFGQYPDELYRELFRPVAAVRERVEIYASRFSAHTVGLHIRRSDHLEAREKSPTQLFIDAARREADTHDDLRLFLATDDEEVKSCFRATFGNRVITSAEAASRDSSDGIRDGLADMYTLARTSIIYGSAGSTFSPMAARIGSVPLKILST